MRPNDVTYGREQRGFTLIELLVAVTILTILTGIVYASFVSVTESAALARENIDHARYHQILSRHLNTHLSALYVDSSYAREDYLFLGEDGEDAYGPADRLQFVTTVPFSGPHALPGLLKVVTYEVGEDLGDEALDVDAPIDAPAELFLFIREEPLVLEALDGGLDTGASARSLLGLDPESEDYEDEENPLRRQRKIPVSTADFLYYDSEAEEWVEEWDSSAEQRMPWAVRVKVNFARTEEELDGLYAEGIDLMEEPDLDVTVAFPITAGIVDPFMNLNQRRESGLVENTDGMASAT